MFTCNGKTYAITKQAIIHKQGDFKADYTVVGSPTITNNGVVSGFSTSNYLILPKSFISNEITEGMIVFTTASDITTAQGLFLTSISDDSSTFGISNGVLNLVNKVYGSYASFVSLGLSLTPNTKYYFKFIQNGTSITPYKSTNGIDFIQGTTVTRSAEFGNWLGYGLGNDDQKHFLGSIDLLQSYIKINNELRWSGFYTEDVAGYKHYIFTKKGIIHKAGDFKRNFNVIGGPTISNEGVVSRFSTSNYIQLPNVFKPGSSPWERVICFTTGSNVSSVQIINFINPVEDTSRSGGGFLAIYQGKVYMSLSSTNTSWNIINDNAGKTTLSPNTTYYVKLKFTGTEYQKWLSTTGEFNGEETLENTVVSSTPIYQANTLGDRFGFRMSALSQVFGGSIDLSQSYIKINDEYWWSGVYLKDVYGDKYY